jgi:hypothetical protein
MGNQHDKAKTKGETMTNLPGGPQPEIDDFTIYSDGDSLDRKTIASVIFKSDNFIVFVDKERNLAWLTNSTYGDYADDFGAVMHRVDLLLSTPTGLLTANNQVAFKRLIGGAIARLLDDKESDNANSILDKAEGYLKTRTTESARIWFLCSTLLISVVAVLFGAVLMTFRDAVQRRVGITTFEIALATLMGSIGAFISLGWRVTDLNVDPMAGPGVHYFEGAVRAIAGMAGAFFVTLCVKANIVLGLMNATDKTLPFLLVLGCIAGASERLVPN